MSELRWHSLLEQWVAVATNRQDRPQMPADWCPFCPGSGRVPEHYDVLLYPNDFPAFDPHSSEPFDPAPGLFKRTGARGSCDVVIYSPDHSQHPSHLKVRQWLRIISLWHARTAELAAIPEVQYVMVFENTGEAIGVTMPHPHGQIYAFPFFPPLVEKELGSASRYYRDKGECLYCELLRRELEEGFRIVAQTDGFVAFVPFAARFPGEIHIYSRTHFGSLSGLTTGLELELAQMLASVRRKYDNLYGFLLPLMMVVRQSPVKGVHNYHHFHIEFLPLQRSAKKLKYLAAVESAAGTYLADTSAEERAAELRASAPTEIVSE